MVWLYALLMGTGGRQEGLNFKVRKFPRSSVDPTPYAADVKFSGVDFAFSMRTKSECLSPPLTDARLLYCKSVESHAEKGIY